MPQHDNETDTDYEQATTDEELALDFYWRPGCMFCSSLRRSMKRRGIPLRLHNIWDDPAAADLVRSVAGGNETVPTVVIGGQTLVNPTPQAVEALVAEVAPGLLPPQDQATAGPRGWFKRFARTS